MIGQKQVIQDSVKEDVQVVSSAELEEVLAEAPPEIRQEVISINETANKKAFSLTLFTAAAVAGLAFVLSLFMPRIRLE